MASKRERVKDLVRKLDMINEERERLARSAEHIEHELDELLGESAGQEGTPDESTTQAVAISRFSKAGSVLAMIKSGTLPDLNQLAHKFYGKVDSKTRNRVRSLLYYLEQQNLIRKTGPESYEPVEHAPMEDA